MRLRNLAQDESGTILPLIIGYAALAMALVVFATAAISLHVTQKRLDGVADASALAGAQGYVLSVAPNGATATLNPSDVRANAQRVAQQGDNVTLVSADVIDGTTATATVSTVWHPPILSPLVPDGFTLFATGTSRTALDGN